MPQLQAPNLSNSVVSSSPPPSQTATLVGPMAAEITSDSQHELNSNWENSPEMTMAKPGSSLATVFPRVSITFLLGSGKRKTLDFEQSDSFGAIKERLVREWPTDWDGELKPQSASAIRFLHLGRLLSDDETLSGNPRFAPRPTPPTIVHLSVRPYTARSASGTGSLKAKSSLLRTGNSLFSGRGNANAPGSPHATIAVAPAGVPTTGTSRPLDSVEESEGSSCCCVIC